MEHLREPFEFSFLSRAYRSRSNQTICLCSNCSQTCGQKIFGNSSYAEVVGKRSIFPENAKNKAENEPFSALFGLSDKT